jgi:hypothetical protein
MSRSLFFHDLQIAFIGLVSCGYLLAWFVFVNPDLFEILGDLVDGNWTFVIF